jgi:hypothetical protein
MKCAKINHIVNASHSPSPQGMQFSFSFNAGTV